MNIPKIKNNIQDRNSKEWILICEYIDRVAEEGSVEFWPRKYLGDEVFLKLYSLPESISKLKKVKKMVLYGSNLKIIPPEIGYMESLKEFIPYTSYDLRWFPYEITNCKKLKNSTISTRALFGNFKNKKKFPLLTDNSVRYFGNKLNCSVCKKEMEYDFTDQYWISLNVGTDIIPLLVNVCSEICKFKIPKPPKGYIQNPHKGG